MCQDENHAHYMAVRLWWWWVWSLVVLCSLERAWWFGGTYHHQLKQMASWAGLPYSTSLGMKAVCPCNTLECLQSTQCCSPADRMYFCSMQIQYLGTIVASRNSINNVLSVLSRQRSRRKVLRMFHMLLLETAICRWCWRSGPAVHSAVPFRISYCSVMPLNIKD
jgi:hypothetical protein